MRAVLAAALLAWALPAVAADLHVAPGRWDSPCSPEDPCGLEYANDTAQPGDVIRMAPGDYWDFIQPMQSGTPGARITYLGVEGDTTAVRVWGIILTRNRITVKWVSTLPGRGATIEWDPAYAAANGNVSGVGDSLYRCSVGTMTLYGAKHSVVAECVLNGPVSIRGNGGSSGFKPGQCTPDSGLFATPEADTIVGCRIELGEIRPGERSFHVTGLAQRCVVERNRVTGTFRGGGDESAIALMVQNASYNVFRHNRWVLEAADSSLDQRQFRALTLRDSARFNRFERDTVLAGLASAPGTGQIHYFLGQFGNQCWPWGDATGRNRWNGCFLKLTGAVQQQIELIVDTLTNNVIVSRGDRAMEIGRFRALHMRHNTLFAVQQGTGLGAVGALNMTGAPADGASGGVTSNLIHSNIFYSGSAPGCDGTWNGSSAVHTTRVRQGFIRDRNLYFSPAGPPHAAYADDGGNCLTVEQTCLEIGKDCLSAWGDPMFVDPTFDGFDPRLQPGSPAIALGLGGNAGADLSPPSNVSNLAVVPGVTTARFAWSPSGDNGNSGFASSYEVRLSTAPIDARNFELAERVGTTLADAAGAPGCVGARNLQPCTRYHVAVRAEDDALNPSAGVTSVAFTTACSGAEAECVAGPAPPGPVDAPEPGDAPATAPRLWMDAREARFEIPRALAGAPLRLELIDIAGRVVRVLAAGPAVAGVHRAALDGGGAPALRSGIYFLGLQVGDRQRVRKIAHLR